MGLFALPVVVQQVRRGNYLLVPLAVRVLLVPQGRADGVGQLRGRGGGGRRRGVTFFVGSPIPLPAPLSLSAVPLLLPLSTPSPSPALVGRVDVHAHKPPGSCLRRAVCRLVRALLLVFASFKWPN